MSRNTSRAGGGSMDNRLSAPLTVARAVRLQFRRRVGLLLGTLAIAGVAGYLLGRDESLATPVLQTTTAMKVVGLLLMLGGVGLEVGVVVYVVRTDRARRNRGSPLLALPGSQRRSLRTQVMRNAIEPGTDLTALRLTASGLSDQLWVVWLMAGLTLLATGQVLANPLALLVIIASVVAVAFGVGIGLTIRQATRAEAFLSDHPAVGDNSRS